jgi:hypothetical protein
MEGKRWKEIGAAEILLFREKEAAPRPSEGFTKMYVERRE